MAAVKPFRAVRYDDREAGPLERLVAPPYDVIDASEREHYRARSRHNVVHLTLPDSEEQAARDYAAWLADGVLARDDEPALWWLSQDFVGPDGVPRTRDGLVVSLRAEPYATGSIRPHERTHAGPKEGRLRLLRATRVHFEPIFLLYEGELSVDRATEPELEASDAGVTSRLWRIDERAAAERLVAEIGDASLLIADGHHRYETALAFHEEDGSDESAHLLAVVVPTRQEGLAIFPTHRVVERLGRALDGRRNGATPEEALTRLRQLPRERAAAVVYRRDGAQLLDGDPGELDAAFVERFEPEGVSYTPRAEEAIAAVDAGRAEAAFLLRPPTIEQVAAVAAAGRTMPQKSTYFYPKLLSGLLFHPLAP